MRTHQLGQLWMARILHNKKVMDSTVKYLEELTWCTGYFIVIYGDWWLIFKRYSCSENKFGGGLLV